MRSVTKCAHAVLICGHIGSGKSTVVRSLVETYGWDVVSFGDYVRHVASTLGAEPSRETLQTLGQQLLDDYGVERFLQDVIAFNHPTTSIHLFDGVRHLIIAEALRRTYHAVTVVFLAVDDRRRYDRYVARSSHEPPVEFSEFVRWRKHPVERGIGELEKEADVHIDAVGPPEEIASRVAEILRSDPAV